MFSLITWVRHRLYLEVVKLQLQGRVFDTARKRGVFVKKCSGCEEMKSLNEFYKNGNTKDGFKYKCRTCIKNSEWYKKYHKKYREDNRERLREYRREYYNRNKEYFKKSAKEYRERNKEKIKERNKEYYKNTFHKHKHKRRASRRRYYKENTESAKKSIRRWKKKNPEKTRLYSQRRCARENNLPVNWTESNVSFALEYWDNRCAYCRITVEDNLQWDHYIPISADGCPGTIPTNMLPSCFSCNQNKRAKNAPTWIRGRFDNAEEIIENIENYFNSVDDT